MDFDFNNYGNDRDDDFMDHDHIYQSEEDPDPEPEQVASQDLIPTIERTASVMTPSQDQANDEPESVSSFKVKSEGRDSMDLSSDDPPVVESQQSVAASPAAEDRDRTPRPPSIPSTASPQLRSQSSNASSSAPITPTASIFGGPLHPPGPSIAPRPAVFTAPTPTSSIPTGPNETPTASIFGGPVQRTSSYRPVQPESQVDDDDDEDFVIIEPAQASAAARQKWKSYKPPTTRFDDAALVKREKGDDASQTPTPARLPVRPPPPALKSNLTLPIPPPPKKMADPAKIMAAQRAMLQRSRAQNAHDPGEGSSRGHVRPEPRRPSFDHFEDDAFGTSDRPDSAMGGINDDNSWMEEVDDVDDEYDGWIKLRDMLLRKQRAGTIKPGESMALFKVKNSIETRNRLRTAASRADGEEEEESLFLPQETREETIQRHRRECLHQEELEDARSNSGDEEDEDEDDQGDGKYIDDEAMARMMAEEDIPRTPEDFGLTKAGKPRKRRAKVAKTPLEYMQRQDEKRREKDRAIAQKKKGRQPTIVASSSRRKVRSPVVAKGKGKGKDKGKGKEKEKPIKKGRGKGKGKGVVTEGQSLLASGAFRSFGNNDTVAGMILDDLMSNDPIADRLQNPIFNRPAEETITGIQVKATQFQRLFANIPEPEDAFTRGAVRSDKAKLRDASKSFGYAKCKAKDGKWLIKRMKSPLYHHQLLGAQWMVQRELSTQAPHGGILADSMGLGKTVQTLACMVGNPAGDGDLKRRVKATLIVGPATITSQWMEEIRTHVDFDVFPKILLYKQSSDIPLAVLEDVDIVVTSYNVVMKQFPFPDKEGKLEIARNGYPAWREGALQNMGVLHQVNWYRVVLDEAQAIKNNSARTSLACQNLKSVYRWCLSGTPLLNKLEELFPYLRFLKANYSMDWGTFQKYFCDPNAKNSHSRIATLLSYTMMRRTMKTSILNRPIITLPKPHPKIQYVNFSPEETIIYRITENRFRNNLNTFFKKGEASRNYGVFMVQLLRLRQCTSHPFMLERTIKECWTMEDVQELRKRLSKLKGVTKPFYEQCQLWVETSEAYRAEARKRGENIPDDEMLPFGQSKFGHDFDMDRALKTLNETELYERVTCSLCSDVPNEPMKTDCGHIFCKDCIETFVAQLIAQESDYVTCPECNRVFQGLEKVTGPSIDPESSSNRRSKSKGKANGKGKGKDRESPEEEAEQANLLKLSKGRDLMGVEPITNDSSWVTKSDREDGFPLTPSTKTTALKAVLLKAFDDAPLDKIVIYVQFRTLARIVGRICNGEGWGFLYLTGDSSLEHRQKAIKRFREDENAKILVAGLKCGGLGLNFPWANRCISLDLWWNHAVEQQAFGRIFRIGQLKETYMTRIVVRNTVDMRMLSMQLHKLQNLEKAMLAGETKERQALSLKQLANLFGFLRTDGDGEILSVEPDYEDEDGEDGSGRSPYGYGGGVGSQDHGDVFMSGGNGNGGGGSGTRESSGQSRRRGTSAERGELSWNDMGVESYGRDGSYEGEVEGHVNQGYGNAMEVDSEDDDEYI